MGRDAARSQFSYLVTSILRKLYWLKDSITTGSLISNNHLALCVSNVLALCGASLISEISIADTDINDLTINAARLNTTSNISLALIAKGLS